MKTHKLKKTDSDTLARCVLHCGGKPSATPLSESAQFAENLAPSPDREFRRRFVVPEQSKSWRNILMLGMCSVVLYSTICASSFGQYTLRRSSFSTVGSKSTGGNFSVRSAVGVTGAGATASGGRFSVRSSLWSVFVAQTPGAPLLRIFITNSAAVVAWPAPSTGWVLQQNTNLTIEAGWAISTATINVVGSENQITVSPPAGNRFYRLTKP